MHTGYISTAYFSSSRTLVTGGTDNLICMWKLKQDKTNNFTLLECLRGHTSVIITLTASRAYSILVSGSEDKTAIIWDLNRMKYVRSLMGHENSVQLVRVNNSTGDIITCSGHILRLWTINGELLLSKSTCPSSESILSCVFYDEQANEWTGRDTIITGHKKGIIKVWAKEIIQDSKTGGYQWGLVLKRQLQQMDTINRVPDVSDIVFLNFM
ncbi:WD40-repeat-containing domain protein, partial [Spinellus fusiger]